ncbi:Glycine betaine transporter OpuD [Novipirellula galeiformis]|uniref:Glycine betaine transporter OpuD n=1 Tax=Novipirellula galeiformis TaxID=2528004 RepID=A0A5C6CPX3_9BACT|nr:BCCT family transporter [Novipirellula galeiformis]TWU25461.1 Glycine betaine transporter OpuD [Novipirellula galeiformis]
MINAQPKRAIRRRVLGVEIEAHPVVFPVSAIIVVGFVIATAAAPRRAMMLFDYLQTTIAEQFSWLYLAAMTGFLLFAIYLCFSRFGNILLGKDGERPEFSTMTWFAMLFSAGMGIGMLFFGVAEPMLHFVDPPNLRNGVIANAESLAAARGAMGITLFHWCLHPWALYSLVGVSLAYFSFRRGMPLSFRSVFYPLLGKRIDGWLGDSIDILSVVATLFGLATSLGLGAKQINAGLSYVFGLPQSTTVQIILIACITMLAVGSLLSGLHVGVRRLSELNMVLAGSLLVFLFVAGPTVYLLGAVVDNAGAYAERLPHASFWTASYAESSKSDWLASWTLFYWGWWIAWSPFVGMFIARVSRGRTIREFITGVLLVPSGVAIVWLTGFGNTAMHQEIYKSLDPHAATITNFYDYTPQQYDVQIIDPASGLPQSEDGAWLIGATANGVASPQGVQMRQSPSGLLTKSGNAVEYVRGVLVHAGTWTPYHPTVEERFHGPFKSEHASLSLSGYLTEPVLTSSHRSKVDTSATAMFVMLRSYPFPTVTALLGVLCVILFFVTSSDSASLVADIIASGGSPNPTVGTRLFWGILEGVLASVLLLAGGLKALQTGSITIGLPFCVLIILMCISLLKALREEVDAPEIR